MSVVDVHSLVVKLRELGEAALPDAQVLDGVDYSEDLEQLFLVVGLSGPNAASATVNRVIDEGSPVDTLFEVSVPCAIALWDGDEEFAKKRGRVQATLTAFADAVEADNRLDGLAADAWVSPEQSWYEVGVADGNLVQVEFPVTIRVFVP